jgi:polyphosphate glucokinase
MHATGENFSLQGWYVKEVTQHPIATLAIDVGGTGIKGAVLDGSGQMITKRVRASTPYPMPPDGPTGMVEALVRLAAKLPTATRVAIGFPGVVRDGRILVAPHFESPMGLGTKVDKTLQAEWRGFDLAEALSARLGVPVEVANDAEMQGLAVISRSGIEVVCTLGTGFGFALYRDGVATPHMEMGSMPLLGGKTLDRELGNKTRKRTTESIWSPKVVSAIEMLDTLINFDHCYIGGGNARNLSRDAFGPLLKRVTIVGNVAGILGGHYLFNR